MHTFQLLSTRIQRLASEASLTVKDVPGSSAARAAFTDFPVKSGIFPPAVDGAATSFDGHVSASFTEPKSSVVSVLAVVAALMFCEQTFQSRSRIWWRSRPSESCDLSERKPCFCALS
ncbi:hypothetical protein ACFQ51_05110 [Streptomyces kaempferi]